MMTLAEQQASGLPRMIRGTVVTQRRRCGKPNCHCADGQVLHESTVLSYSEAGRSRTVMLEPDEIATVRAATARYRAALAKIEREGNTGLQALRARRAGDRLGGDAGNVPGGVHRTRLRDLHRPAGRLGVRTLSLIHN